MEKTPDNLRHWSLIQSIWEDPLLIHVTRDYRDTYASWKVRRKDSLEDFLAAATAVYDDIYPLLGTQQERYLEVDYADLVTSTEDTMRRVLDKVKEPWVPECATLNLQHTGAERRRVREVLNRDSLTSVSLSRSIFTDSIGQWREHLVDEEVTRIVEALGPIASKLGQEWA